MLVAKTFYKCGGNFKSSLTCKIFMPNFNIGLINKVVVCCPLLVLLVAAWLWCSIMLGCWGLC